MSNCNSVVKHLVFCFVVLVYVCVCLCVQPYSTPPLLHQAPTHPVMGILQDVPVQSPPGHETHREQDQHGVHATGL